MKFDPLVFCRPGFSALLLLVLTGGQAEAAQSKRAFYADKPARPGPRPYYLIGQMADSPLKTRLSQCANEKNEFHMSDFSIGHRGAPLQFPEHSRESYEAAARMGAGVLECDVTFTKDRQLVCRHAQCDLHTTTNILATPLAAKCSVPFRPADPAAGTPAEVKCCASDFTLKEFKTLCGKMDAFNPMASTVEYMQATPGWRTDLYATCGTVLSHRESIRLFQELGTRFTPELKAPEVPMPYEGDYTQEDYADQLIDEYRQAGVDPADVMAQSFNRRDVLHWINKAPEFGRQAVYLDDRVEAPGFVATAKGMEDLFKDGIRIIAPPMWALLSLDSKGAIQPSEYAGLAKKAGLSIITWTLERSGTMKDGGGWYHQTVGPAIRGDGDTFVVLDVLAKEVGVLGVFSDWPATTTFYANCMEF